MEVSSTAKERRAGKPRVRTGCLICKTRKVKCDETKPECNRCSRFGTACRYSYAPPHETPVSRAQRLRNTAFAPIKPRIPALITQEPSNSIPGDESERRYFQLFHERLAYDISGYFESPFWTRVIPQECHHEPAIRHAILALSALCKASASKIETVDANNKHLDFALVQQSKAISSFRKSLFEGRPLRTQVRLALMASLLFGCFESFHGNSETASQQISSGLNILGQLEKHKVNRTNQNITFVDPELGLSLSRLQLQMESFLAMNPMTDHLPTGADDVEFIEDFPNRFAALSEALPFAVRISINTLRHMRKASRCGNIKSFQETLERERDSVSTSLDQWNKAFRPILLKIQASQNTASRAYLSVCFLQTTLVAFETILATTSAKKEIIYDRFTEQFRRIVSSCRHALEIDREIRTLDSIRAQFSIGWIMMLYYVATRCRDSLIRRDAIAILREFPSKNGIWDSLQAAKAAEWIANLEEKGSAGVVPIPEAARVRMNSLKAISHENGIDVECIQGPSDGISKLRMANLVLS